MGLMTPATKQAVEALRRLREQGWSVAVHNDYRQDGKSRTFWLLTHPSGRWVKGEGATDDEALALAALGAASGLTALSEMETTEEERRFWSAHLTYRGTYQGKAGRDIAHLSAEVARLTGELDNSGTWWETQCCAREAAARAEERERARHIVLTCRWTGENGAPLRETIATAIGTLPETEEKR